VNKVLVITATFVNFEAESLVCHFPFLRRFEGEQRLLYLPATPLAPLPNRWRDIGVDQDFAWRILAFCEPSWFIDPDRAKARTKTLISLRNDTSEKTGETRSPNNQFWKDPRMLEWASKEDSSLLILQGLPMTIFLIERASVELADYLEENGRQVVWVFNALSRSGPEKLLIQWTSASILRQIAVQIMRKNPSFNSLGRLAAIVELMVKANSDDEWLGVISAALDGLREVYVIIDLGVLGADYGPTMSWPASFTKLFGVLRESSPKTILKVFLLLCRPMPKEVALRGTPVIPVSGMTITNVFGVKHPKQQGSNIRLPLLQVRPEATKESTVEVREEEIPESEPSIIGETAAAFSKRWDTYLNATSMSINRFILARKLQVTGFVK
jgi:hypothetical protein